jgi:nickel/cobalt transporter (NiCoT) family protein
VGAPAPAETRLGRIEKAQAGLLYLAIFVVTGVAFFLLYLVGATYSSGSGAGAPAVAWWGTGLFAYVLGLRHGVDADHIAAIDNTTRKLLQEGKRPLSVGTWFSLGHSTVVVALIVALVVAFGAVQSTIPALHSAGAIVGTVVSGVFLVFIGLLNLVITLEVLRIYRGLRRGVYDAHTLEEELAKRGFLNRYFGRLFRLVERPSQIYPIGVLFGVGFDTASEVAVIGASVAFGIAGVPLVAVLLLPLLFACGMVVVDTTDGITMRYAYGWAFEKPLRKVYYNLTVTVVSVLVAFAIGGVELLSVLAAELHLSGGFVGGIASLNFEWLGILVVGLFVGVWLVALAYYRWKHLDESPAIRPEPPGKAPG